MDGKFIDINCNSDYIDWGLELAFGFVVVAVAQVFVDL